MKYLMIFAAVLGMNACNPDGNVAGYTVSEKMWALQELDGKPFTAKATIGFPGEGRIAGEAPCNHYFGNQTGAYPAFTTENMGATKMACPDLEAEDIFLKALSEMSKADIAGDVVTLSNAAGRKMVFKAE